MEPRIKREDPDDKSWDETASHVVRHGCELIEEQMCSYPAPKHVATLATCCP
jgi:hypothetical protein